ncbi:hypothetical protein HYE11_00250 [Mycoplasmopsis bovis]|nr:hypothetical protein HYE11_00250 [Mycoplasmopsis bovis]
MDFKGKRPKGFERFKGYEVVENYLIISIFLTIVLHKIDNIKRCCFQLIYQRIKNPISVFNTLWQQKRKNALIQNSFWSWLYSKTSEF